MSFKLDKPAMFSVDGYKRHSKDVNNKQNIIASGDITMEDVDFPVHGVDNLGNEKIMEPGKDYSFPGDIVLETPLRKKEMPNFDKGTKGFKMGGFPMIDGTASHLKQKKLDWSKAPKAGTQERTLWYQKHNLALDETTPKLQEYPIYVDKFQEASYMPDWEGGGNTPIPHSELHKYEGKGSHLKQKYNVETEEHDGASRIQFENVKTGKTTGYTTVDSSDDDYRVYKTKGGKTKEISKKKYKRQLQRKLDKQV